MQLPREKSEKNFLKPEGKQKTKIISFGIRTSRQVFVPGVISVLKCSLLWICKVLLIYPNLGSTVHKICCPQGISTTWLSSSIHDHFLKIQDAPSPPWRNERGKSRNRSSSSLSMPEIDEECRKTMNQTSARREWGSLWRNFSLKSDSTLKLKTKFRCFCWHSWIDQPYSCIYWSRSNFQRMGGFIENVIFLIAVLFVDTGKC